MNRSTPLVWSRLFLPHPLPASQVAAFLTRLASDRAGHPVVLETRADSDGIQYLLGCDATFVHPLRRLLTDLIPGTIMAGLESYTRPSMIVAGHLIHKPAALPVAADPIATTRALYSALSKKHPSGEAVCVQLVLGAGNGPRVVPPKIPAPDPTVWQLLTTGHPTASAETRNRVRDRAAHHSLDVVLRVGANARTADRRQRLVRELESALAITETPGVRLILNREDPNRLNTAPLTRRGVRRLAVPEVVAFAGWPLGDEPLPGMLPAHPKLLRADPAVHSTSRTFAVSAVPGDTREFGLTAPDMTFHGFALGPTGVGKSTLLEQVAEHAIRAGEAVLILDPKAEMHLNVLGKIPQERWKDVVVIDGTEDNPIGFNPLDVTGRDPDVVADSVLAVFAAIFADGLGPRSSDIFSAGLRTLTRTGTAANPRTLLDLPRLWTDATFRRRLVAQVQDDEALAGFWAWYDGLKPAAQANVVAAPMNKLRQVLLRPAAVKILGQASRFRLRDLFRERKIVFLPLNQGILGPLTTDLIGALAISEVWQAVQERVSESDRMKHLGLVIVDEADRFVHLPVSLSDALARSRSMAVSWWLAVQFWDQVPRDMKSAIKTNARSKVIFRLESDDDAHTIARLAPGLIAEDFMALPKYHVYLRLVAGGVTTAWALAKTLPPTASTCDPADVLRVSRAHHQSSEPPEPEVVDDSIAIESEAASPAPIGRRRRTT